MLLGPPRGREAIQPEQGTLKLRQAGGDFAEDTAFLPRKGQHQDELRTERWLPQAAAVVCGAGHTAGLARPQPCPVCPAHDNDRAPFQASVQVLSILPRHPNYSWVVTYIIYGGSFF